MKFEYSLVNSSSLKNIAWYMTPERECLKMIAHDGSYLIREIKYPFAVLENALSQEIDDYLAHSGPFPAPVTPEEMGCDDPSELAVEYAVHHLVTGETEFEAFSSGQLREIVLIGNEWLRVSSLNNTISVEKLTQQHG